MTCATTMDIRREILRNVVLCQSLPLKSALVPIEEGSPVTKLEYIIVAGVNSSWAFYDLADRVLAAGRQPDSIFDVAYDAQSASARNRYGGKVNSGQIHLLVPLVTAQVLEFLETGDCGDVEAILERTGEVLRNTTEKDVESLERFIHLGYHLSTKHRQRIGRPKEPRFPVLKGRYANVWDVAVDREGQKIHTVREMTQGYPYCHRVYRFLLHNLETGIMPAAEMIYRFLLPEIGRPDVVTDLVVVGVYLVLAKHPESVLFT